MTLQVNLIFTIHSYNSGCCNILLLTTSGDQDMDQDAPVSSLLCQQKCLFLKGLVFDVFSKNFLNVLSSRYFALAPTILSGKVDPVLFEALYVSIKFFCHSAVFFYLLIVFISFSHCSC